MENINSKKNNLTKLKWGNCLIWALIQKFKYGGTIKSYLGLRFPHFSWVSPTNKEYSYSPKNRFNEGYGYDFIILFEGIPIRNTIGNK